jgi:hypothetical protein
MSRVAIYARVSTDDGKGTRLGRPEIASEVKDRIIAIARERPEISHYAISKAVGVDIKTVQRYRGAACSA